MNKLVTLRLKSMIYSGQNLGPDFRFAISLGGKSTETGKRIRAGETRSFDEVILRVAVPESASQLNLSIVVSESDPLYDDVGSAQSMVQAGGVGEKKKHLLKIPVIGMGWEKKKRAVLKIGLETEIESTLRYVKDVLPDGWLKVKLAQGRVESLPYLLKVALLEEDEKQEGRESFKILEGIHEGKSASVALPGTGKSYLIRNEHHSAAAVLTYSLSKRELTIRGLGKFKIDMDPDNPIPPGTYPMEIPDAPHQLGASYTSITRYAKTWFRLGREGDRYLHGGDRSAGCITVLHKRKWTRICLFLLRSRKDSRTVGMLKVIR